MKRALMGLPLFALTTAYAQQSVDDPPLCVTTSPESCNGYGFALSAVGDLDSIPDGIRDMLIGAPGSSPSGKVFIQSGSDCNANLYELAGGDFNNPLYNADIVFGASVDRVGDINLDGYEEFIVGAPGDVTTVLPTSSGQIVIIDGATGTSIFPPGSFTGGVSTGSPNFEGAKLGLSVSGFGGFGDIADTGGSQPDGVPVPDYMAGAPHATQTLLATECGNTGFVVVYDGGPPLDLSGMPNPSAGAIRYIIDSNDLFISQLVSCPPLRFGHAIDGLGDLDGDGFADLIVGAPETARGNCDPAGLDCFNYDLLGDVFDAGAAYVFSGASGFLIKELEGPTPLGIGNGGEFGYDVCLAGDVNADSIPDIIVGAPFAVDPNATEAGEVGAAFVYSGADLLGAGVPTPMYSFYGDRDNDNLGVKVSAAGDVDADGFADVMARSLGNPNTGMSAYVRVYSGKTGMPLYHIDDLEPTPISEHPDIACLGNVDAGSELEVLVANNSVCAGGAVDDVEVHSITPFADQLLAYPTELDQPGRYQFFIAAGSSHANKSYWIWGSSTGFDPGFNIGNVHIPLLPDAYWNITVLHPNVAPLIDTFGTLDDNGTAMASIRIQNPLGTPPNGLDLYHSALIIDDTVLLDASNYVETHLNP